MFGYAAARQSFYIGALVGAVVAANEAEPVDTYFHVLGPDIEDLGWTPGIAPTAVESEIEDVSAPRDGHFYIPGISKAFDYMLDRLDDLENGTGLRIGTAYTMLFQGLSGGPWDRYGGTGDFDLMTRWTLVGRGSENTVRVVFDIEDRFPIGGRTPASLGGQVATLQPTAHGFNDRGFVVRDFLWEQRLIQGQLRFMIGR